MAESVVSRGAGAVLPVMPAGDGEPSPGVDLRIQPCLLVETPVPFPAVLEPCYHPDIH